MYNGSPVSMFKYNPVTSKQWTKSGPHAVSAVKSFLILLIHSLMDNELCAS